MGTSGTVVTILSALGMIGCSQPTSGHVDFQVTSRPSPTTTSSSSASRLAAGDSVVIALGGDTIVVRRVELVLRHVWLQPAESGECEPEEEEYCAELANRPVIVAFPLSDTAEGRFTAAAKPDAYSGLQFDLYSPAAEDADESLASNAEVSRGSVRLHGMVSKRGDRRDFLSTLALTGIQELTLTTPIRVLSGDTTRLTLRLDLTRVFLSAGGDALLDPATAAPGQPNAHLMQDNIRVALEAFPDENRDGVEDDHEPNPTTPPGS